MGKGLESSASESKRLAYDLNKPVDEILLECSICLEPVNENDARTPVTLRCEHRYHLDCIGSAFNAKNKMECPNCRNVEQGQWSYASGIDGWYHEGGEVDPEFFPDSEEDGVELCPFGGYVHLNSRQWATGHLWSNGRPCCRYHDFLVIPPSPSAAVESFNFHNFLTTGLPVDLLSHHSSLSDLIPVSPTPTNPRFFRSASQPDVIVARVYVSHPYTDLIPRFDNSLANAQVFPSNNVLANAVAVNVPLTRPYPNRSSAADGLVAPQEYNTTTIDWGPVIQENSRQQIDRNLAPTADNEQRFLHNMLFGGGVGISYAGRTNGEYGSSRGGSSSGSGGGNINNSGSG